MKKEISLKRFFIIFLTHAVFSCICVGVLWGCLLIAATNLHMIVPANAVEHSVSVWRSSLDGHTVITTKMLPDGVTYAFFDSHGTLLQTDFSERQLETAMELADSNANGNLKRKGSYFYLRLDTDTQRIVIAYQLIASFASPLLRRIFPNAEIFILLLLFIMLMADLVLIAVWYARKLNRELQKLAAAAGQISRQNLVFDVSKTKLTEFNQIMDSLEHLSTDLRHSLKEQWAMEQQKKRQLTALTHDIKTPLAIVAGNAELLLETEQTEEQKEYTKFILEHAGQIQRYVTGMMELSMADQESGPVCGLGELLAAMARNVESLGKKKHLSCVLLPHNLPDQLPVPKERTQRILGNLIDNAVQYSPENGTVFLEAYLEGAMLYLRVQDEGAGFSGEALSLAATEFYRADPSRGSKEHFGLGLAITERIVTELGGTLRLENAPEKGALVTVCLPIKYCGLQ